MPAESSFSVSLRAARRAAGLTQEQLAERSGVAVRTISDLERGLAAPRLGTAELLAKGLGLLGAQHARFVATGRGSAEPAPAVFRRVLIPPTRLIGREEEAAGLGALLADPTVRLITLTGPGGVGKTRLAAEAAAVTVPSVVSEVIDVDLSNATSQAMLLRETASALGQEDKGQDAAGLAELIGDRSLLLVLDNFEYVVVAAPVLSWVLNLCPQLKILVTSRIPVRIRGEHEVPVLPLAIPAKDATVTEITDSPAVRMFVACARQRRANWRLDAHTVPHTAAICQAVDGIPLAIELAASYIGALDTSEIARRLSEWMGQTRLLTSGPRDMPERQQTIVATIKWSYDLLNPAARALLRRLSVFPASFDADGATAMCGDQDPGGPSGCSAVVALATLVDTGLLRMLRNPSEVRYQLYQTVHEYARDQLEESGERAHVESAHARYVLTLAESVRDHLEGPAQSTWLAKLDPHREDIRFAMRGLIDAGEYLLAQRIGFAVWRYWYARGYLREGYELLNLALGEAAYRDLSDLPTDAIRFRARTLTSLASLHYILGGRDEVRDRYTEAARLWRSIGLNDGVCAALSNLALYEHYSGDRAVARKIYDESLDVARAINDDRHIGSVLQNLGALLMQDGELDAAEPVLDEALSRFRTCGMVRSEADAQGTRAELALARRDFAEARSLARQTRALFEELGDERGLLETDKLSADIALESGDAGGAYGLYASSARGHHDIGDLWGQSEGLLGQARAALRIGHSAEARSLAREARTISARIGDTKGVRATEEFLTEASRSLDS